MSETRQFGVADAVVTALVLGLALGARAWYLSVCAAGGRTAGPLAVQGRPDDDFDPLLQNLSEDRGYAVADPGTGELGRRAHPAPLYPWLLSQLLRVSFDLPSMERLARWLQCALGAATAGLYVLFARRAFASPFVAVLAGLGAALFPFWVVNAAEINDGVLATFLLALGLYTGARAGQEGGALTSWFFGLALAGLALTRAELLPFAVVALLWFLRRCRTPGPGWMPALVAFLGFASGLAPWLIRNYQAFRDVYPVVDSTSYHLWLGHRAGATGPVDAAATAAAPATDRDRGREVLDEWRGNPAGTLGRRLWAGLYFCFGEDWFTKGRLWREAEGTSSEGVPEWVPRAAPALLTGALLALFLLGVVGWRWTYVWNAEAMPSALAVFWVPLPYLLGHAEALHGPRLPLDGVLLCYAAYALVGLWQPRRG